MDRHQNLKHNKDESIRTERACINRGNVKKLLPKYYKTEKVITPPQKSRQKKTVLELQK